jgi:hypothetical protein
MIKIPNFSRYVAGEDGVIYSTNYKRTGLTKPLKPAIGPDGYPQSMFQRDDGVYCSYKIHKMVMLAFAGPMPDHYSSVNHKNGIKSDNRPINLEYCTRSENSKHAYDTGLKQPLRGELNGMSKLTAIQVREIRDHVIKTGPRYGRKGLAQKYNISEATIKDIIGKRRNAWPGV